jgi:hypothetical protein
MLFITALNPDDASIDVREHSTVFLREVTSLASVDCNLQGNADRRPGVEPRIPAWSLATLAASLRSPVFKVLKETSSRHDVFLKKFFPLPDVLNGLAGFNSSPIRPLPPLVDLQLVCEASNDVHWAVAFATGTINRKHDDVDPLFELAAFGGFIDLLAKMINYAIASTLRMRAKSGNAPLSLLHNVIKQIESVVAMRHWLEPERSGSNGLIRSLYVFGWSRLFSGHAFCSWG